MPTEIRAESNADWDVPRTVVGFAIGRDGSPAIVVHAPAGNDRRADM